MKRLILIYSILLLALITTACGHTGGQGGLGEQGPAGSTGSNGLTPLAPLVVSRGATPAECPTGGAAITVTNFYQDLNGTHSYPPTSTVACNGAAGAAGPQGDAGADGSNGQDASGVTVVKFCPGDTVYPSKFVEIGFIISGHLYATYSANGGFSTEIVPGAYSSNAIGSSCNFVVNPDLSISN